MAVALYGQNADALPGPLSVCVHCSYGSCLQPLQNHARRSSRNSPLPSVTAPPTRLLALTRPPLCCSLGSAPSAANSSTPLCLPLRTASTPFWTAARWVGACVAGRDRRWGRHEDFHGSARARRWSIRQRASNQHVYFAAAGSSAFMQPGCTSLACRRVS